MTVIQTMLNIICMLVMPLLFGFLAAQDIDDAKAVRKTHIAIKVAFYVLAVLFMIKMVMIIL